jgi:hypothetical protein
LVLFLSLGTLQELIDADTPADAAAELADVVFFALTAANARGATLADANQQLDLRTLRVTSASIHVYFAVLCVFAFCYFDYVALADGFIVLIVLRSLIFVRFVAVLATRKTSKS